ncbi:motility associated factor glycosyltransferase family protein [Lysinibacillus capsici]|uniref:motility associated factor glycosyltransferase family protein n=1 Tax=Lysinibacillus capsici TaxID=2115968 RepID=UPI0039FD2F4D
MYIDTNIEDLTSNDFNWVAVHNSELEPKFTYLDQASRTAYFTYKNGEIRALQDELESTYQKRVTHREILFVFGLYGINEINQLYQTKSKDTFIIVIEPNLSYFNYSLHYLNLSVFSKEKICLFADDQVDNIISFLQPILHDITVAKLLKKVNFYFTSYYRQYDGELIKKYIELIRQTVTSTVRSFGNDIEDSLIGLKHNLKNLSYILKSKNTTQLLNIYQNIPAIVVAAGPSLNKNIQHLKTAKGKALIIAVDTIVERLLREEITPDFICSIERVPEVYDYFYKDKKLAKEITLVGPGVLDSRIFEEFKGAMIIPFRNEVAETKWLQRIMKQPKSSGISMGLSCAHVAFGLADHFGCSPIILIGQDLAYGENEDETHAAGTLYDSKTLNTQKRDQDFVEGYYGGKVLTTRIWLQFKTWFEKRIGEAGLKVIDATEGGARIYLTERQSLKDSIEKYCTTKIIPINEVFEKIGTYSIDKEKLKKTLEQEIKYYNDFLENLINYFNRIEKMDITHDTLIKSNDQLSVVHYIVKDAMSNELIMHNMQSTLLRYLWTHNSREQIISRENVQAEKNEQIKLLGVMARTIYEIKELVKEAQQQLEKELEK